MKLSASATRFFTIAIVVAIAVLPTEARRRPQVKTDLHTDAKLASIVESSGATYKKVAEGVWVVKLKGDALADIDVIVTSAEGLILLGVVVAQKKTMQVSPEMMRTLLKLVHNIDFVKIGFDDDDDLFVRIELPARLFDLEEFKADLQQIAAASDKVYVAIKPFRAQNW